MTDAAKVSITFLRAYFNVYLWNTWSLRGFITSLQKQPNFLYASTNDPMNDKKPWTMNHEP
jgi:hypothetical protein